MKNCGAWGNLVQMPGEALRVTGRWAASRPALRRLAKWLFMRWPGVRWRVKLFLRATPGTVVVSPASRSHGALLTDIGQVLRVSQAVQAGEEYYSQEGSEMFSVTESMRAVIDVEALKTRIRREIERQQGR